MENKGIDAAVLYLASLKPKRFILTKHDLTGPIGIEPAKQRVVGYERVLADYKSTRRYYLDRSDQLDPNSELLRVCR